MFENKTKKGVPSFQRIADHSPPRDDTFFLHFLSLSFCLFRTNIWSASNTCKPFILFTNLNFVLTAPARFCVARIHCGYPLLLFDVRILLLLLARLHFLLYSLVALCLDCVLFCPFFLFQSLPVAIVCSPNDLPSIQKEMVKIILLRLI